MFTILWSENAIKQLKKLPRPIASRIFQSVGKLKENPYRNLIKVAGSDTYRLRVGDYRVLIDINNAKSSVLVLKVWNKNVYE